MQFKLIPVFLIVVFAAPDILQAQTETKLVSSDNAFNDRFGIEVSLSGEYALIGAVWDDDNGGFSGSAYIFEHQDTSWLEVAKLIASDGESMDAFGESVSLSGDYALIGAPRGNDPGSAYVFKRDGRSWVEQAKLVASDGEANDLFGVEVSLSGEYAFVGAFGDDDNGSESGAVYVFKRQGESWVEQVKLVASDGEAYDFFGHALSVSGEYAFVGAFADDDNGDESGSVYIYKQEDATWMEQAKLVASDGDQHDRFGHSVAISGDYALVGALWDEDSTGKITGSTYVFKRDDTMWVEQAKLVASDNGESFGESVALSGDYALIGDDEDNNFGEDAGAAYVFKREGTTWVELTKLVASDGADNDMLGFSVSISGEHALIGTWGTEAAYIYNLLDIEEETAVDDLGEVSSGNTLFPNYPNPFFRSTSVSYSLEEVTSLKLSVFDALGREVHVLDHGVKAVGSYHLQFFASKLPAGIYLLRLEAGESVITKKMVLVD